MENKREKAEVVVSVGVGLSEPKSLGRAMPYSSYNPNEGSVWAAGGGLGDLAGSSIGGFCSFVSS